MERWVGKTAIITGASSGIGAAIAVDLTNAGINVVGFARREERIEKLQSKIKSPSAGKLYAYKCDVGIESNVLEAFKWVIEKFGGIDILVNNAAVAHHRGRLVDKNNSEFVRNILDINVLGSVYCIREAFQSMADRSVAGHIIIINSILGHKVIYSLGMTTNMYAPSKHALTAMTEVLRQEFQGLKSNVKITSISPGAVITEMLTESYLNSLPIKVPVLNAEDIASAVSYVLSTPPHVQVCKNYNYYS